ncbi:ABC transporter substrate-binding protein/permease [Vagococcus teuberi]|uniref:ABC transporter permease n=1 Tax=Vagococcus teuberi TaxID=519472 RepID=A0A1J0A7K3_9ENTE|nr:ABC transporter substrate-binding protein/permease [Vagococcus teuberi]APB31918.1 ABC transporter permease [Vagococcus teuberi]
MKESIVQKTKHFIFITIIFSLLIPIISLAGIPDPYLKKVQDKKELVVGLSAFYAPYEFHATVDGKDTIVGTDILIAEKIAKDMRVKLKIEEYSFDALLGALKTGKIDLIISGMTPTPERLKEVDFSDSYMTVQQKIVIRKSDKEKYTSLDSLKGVKVGAQVQTKQEELANEELQADTVSLQNVPDIILQLQQNKIDAAVIEEPVAEAYLTQDQSLMFADIDITDSDKETAIALPKNSPDLLKTINHSIQEINDKRLMLKYKNEVTPLMFPEKSFLNKYAPYYIKGTGYTIFLAIIGVLFGSILGTLLALMKQSKNKLFKWISVIYIEYVRGTPLLVQIFLVFFGLNVLGINLSALASSCVALSLNSGAYVAEIIRAGLNAVDKGQAEAARSLGMSQKKAMRYIIMPQAIKNILPALGNEFVTVIKESSVVSVIGVSELMFQAGVVRGASFKPFLPILIASLIYFVLTFTLSRALGVAERRIGAND